MHEWNSTTELARHQPDPARKQTRQLQVALVLLLMALAVVIVKDREFWFGPDQTVASDATAPQSTPNSDAAVAAAKNSNGSVTQTAAAKKHPRSKASAKPVDTAIANPESAASDAPVVATRRTILPPLDVEVVAGDTHSTVHAGSNSNVTRAEIPRDSSRLSITTANLATNASESERLSAGTAPELRQTVDTTYPLLGQHMRVQGSVVLQAVVGADGTIEDLRVLSGPAILTAAAQQAVRQWHFKPYLLNGHPVETKAKLTVNFSIRVSDNPATS